MKDPYEILCIDKNATEEEIKKSYRKLAMETHPDRGGDEEKFKEISEAYSILSDEDKKRQYDQFGHIGNGNNRGGGGFSGSGNIDDLINSFFGGGGFNGGFNGGKYTKHQQRGSDLRMKISLTLDEIVNGCTKKIKYRRYDKCVSCSGKGAKEFATCKGCGGSGIRVQVQQTPIGRIQNTTVCNLCSGDGKLPLDKCQTCHTKGIIFKDEEFEIDMPPGSSSEVLFTKNGLGNCVKDGVAGNLVIMVEEINHPIFKRNGNNLECTHWISVIDAILGCKFDLKSINETIEINISPGCQSGDIKTLKRKGIPNIESRNPGDILITVKVKIPLKISQEEKELLEKIKDSKNFKI